LYDLAGGAVVEEPTEIVGVIRSAPETPRRCTIEQAMLAEIRAKIEKAHQEQLPQKSSSAGRSEARVESLDGVVLTRRWSC